jgi:electron transport complex protein RnfB
MAIASVQEVDDILPQTQCDRCGKGGCLPYARAMIEDGAAINRCPPGGTETIAALARLLGRPVVALDPECGEHEPLHLALIDEALCIGCTLCIQACPVDAILGAVNRMHTVLPALCTGCALCIPPCPMDCIAMVPPIPERAWTREDAHAARRRMHAREERLERERREELDGSGIAHRTSIVERAIERAKARLGMSG